jgi:hypothetical protein
MPFIAFPPELGILIVDVFVADRKNKSSVARFRQVMQFRSAPEDRAPVVGGICVCSWPFPALSVLSNLAF